jgi:hypothetical protein
VFADPAAAQTTKRPARKGKSYAVTIDSAPQQATIYLDDRAYGTVGYTPYAGRLVAGDYLLIVEVPGYKPIERQITVGPKSLRFFYQLERTNGTIDVRADADPNAAGAHVYINGEARGTVPTQVPVGEGRVLVEIKKQGWSDLAQWMDVKAGERVTFAPQLKQQAQKGGLLVDADVPGAQVLIDGKEVPDTTPAIVDDLTVGPHVVEVRKPPAQPWRSTVDIRANTRVKVNAALGPVGGSVRVLSNRDDAEVWLDGDPKGKAPIDLGTIPPGLHLVEVKAKGWKTREQRLSVQAGQSSVLQLDLVDKALGGPAGRIRVVSPVPEAAVAIDGAPVGNAPYEGELVAGPHFVLVQKPGFGRMEKQVMVEEGKVASVTADLRAAGAVRFVANVDDAEVLVDGRPVGRTPLTLDSIDAGEHVVTVRRAGYAEYNEKIHVDGGTQTTVNASLADDPARVRRGLATWGANPIPAGHFAVDAGTGYPYYIELRAIAGVTESRFLPWDFGLEFRSVGLLGTWEFLASARVRLLRVEPFALALFAGFGAGGGTIAGRSELTFQGGAIGTMQMTNILSVSAKGWLDFWSDRLCQSPTATSGGKSEDGPDVCTQTASAEDEAHAIALVGSTAADLYKRDVGLRLMLSVVVEAAVSDTTNLYFTFEGAPFQNDRAGHSKLFTPTLLGKNDPIYNARIGLTFKF